jgi:hypothetical protein
MIRSAVFLSSEIAMVFLIHVFSTMDKITILGTPKALIIRSISTISASCA